MQIIGGIARGTKLTSVAGKTTRPTSQRSREAIFNLLMGSRFSPTLQNAHIIDVFAGTGAVGLEALSRGAAFASFIEADKMASKIIQTNIQKLRFEARSKLLIGGFATLRTWQTAPADIIFSDAPYAEGLTEAALLHLATIGALKSEALIIAETHKKEQLTLPEDFVLRDRRNYGIAAVSLYNWAPQET